MRRLLARIRGPIAFWAVAGVALLISHDAVFLAQVGPGHELAHALREAGHEYWGIASLALAAIGIATLAATLVRLRSLRRSIATLGADPAARPRPYAARWLVTWARLLAVVAIGFAIQENIEHIIGHSHAPGLGALIGPEYPLALPVIALITGLAALVAAVLGQTEQALLAVIADAMRQILARAPRRTSRPPLRLAAVLIAPLAGAWAGRAPPWSFVSAS
jgi:hypothetical protein